MQRSFVTAKNDLWLLGLASTVCWGAVLLLHGLSTQFAFASQSLHAIEILMPTILILTSYPHLLISYKYGYTQGTAFTLKNWPHLIAAPLTLISIFGLAAMTWTTQIGSFRMGHLALSFVSNIFILGSGWHAMRQVYGIVLIYSNFKEFKFTSIQRKLLLANLYGVFLIDFVNLNLTGNNFSLFGLQFSPLGFNSYILYGTFALTTLTGFLLVYSLMTSTHNTNGRFPPKEALVAILALYIWALPCFFLPEFTIFAPNIFHSIQYFAVLYKVERPNKPVESKLFWLKKWTAWTIGSAIFIKFIPDQLDRWVTVTNQQSFGFFSFCFFTFANLQHYFIDSCIWKSQSGSKLLKVVQQPDVVTSSQSCVEPSGNHSTIAA